MSRKDLLLVGVAFVKLMAFFRKYWYLLERQKFYYFGRFILLAVLSLLTLVILFFQKAHIYFKILEAVLRKDLELYFSQIKISEEWLISFVFEALVSKMSFQLELLKGQVGRLNWRTNPEVWTDWKIYFDQFNCCQRDL